MQSIHEGDGRMRSRVLLQEADPILWHIPTIAFLASDQTYPDTALGRRSASTPRARLLRCEIHRSIVYVLAGGGSANTATYRCVKALASLMTIYSLYIFDRCAVLS